MRKSDLVGPVIIAIGAVAAVLAVGPGAEGQAPWRAGQRCVMVDSKLRATNCRVSKTLARGRVRIAVDVPASKIRKPKPPKPTPTPSPTATPSPSPEPTPTITPEPTPSPTPDPTPSPTPTPTPDPSGALRLSTSGSDTGNCQASPCRTMGYAYAQAAPGDVVEMAAGSYGGQNLTRRTMLDSAAQRIVFRPAAGAAVTTGSLSFGASYDALGAWHVEIRDMTVNGAVDLRRTKDVVFRNVRLNHAFGFGADNTEFHGGEWGIQHSTSGTHPEFSRYGCDGTRACDTVDGLLLDGVHVHHIGRTNESVHTNCFHVWGDGHRNITVRNSRFDHCDVFSSLISGAISGVVFDGNRFEPSTNTNFTGSAFYSVMLTRGVSGVAFRRNQFDMEPTLNQPSTPGLVTCENTGQVPASWQGPC